jgi:hypothetical protein
MSAIKLPEPQFSSWHGEVHKSLLNPTGCINAFPWGPRKERDAYWRDKGYHAEPLYTAEQMREAIAASRSQAAPFAAHPLDALLPEICQLLDTCREDFMQRGLWTEWDQSVRDRITAYNLSKMGAGHGC